MVAAGVALVVVGCVVGGETETLSVQLPEFLSSVTNISNAGTQQYPIQSTIQGGLRGNPQTQDDAARRISMSGWSAVITTAHGRCGVAVDPQPCCAKSIQRCRVQPSLSASVGSGSELWSNVRPRNNL